MELFRLFGSILIDDKDAINSLRNVDDRANKTHKVLAGFGKVAAVAGAAVAAGIGTALVVGLKDAMKAEEKVAQLDAVLKSTGGAAGMAREDLLALAEGFEKTTKFSAEAALEAESLLLTFTNIGKDTFPRATQAAADMATAMGTDMAGQSIALGKALNDPTKGITALTRVGVTFSEEQKNTIKTMQATGDMAGAQAIILAELEKEFGGSAAAAGQTFAGKMEILKNGLGAVSEKLATTLMPYLQQLVDWVVKHMPEIQAVMDTVFKVIGAVVFAVSEIFTTYLLPVIKSVVAWVKENWPAISTVISAVFTVVKTVIGAAIAVITGIFTGFGKIISVITGIFTAIKDAITNPIKTAKDIISGIVDKIKGFFDFKVTLPKIKLPHFAVKPSGWKFGDLLKGEIPSLGIDWYSKGGIFDSPTIFPTASGLKGVGEAGPEAVTPISTLLDYVRTAVKESNGNDKLVQLMETFMRRMLDLKIVLDTGEVVGLLASPMDRELQRLLERR